MSTQVKFSFDAETIKKVVKSFWISAIPAAIVFVLAFIANLPIENVALATFVGWVIPTLTYSVGKVKEGTLTWAKFAWSCVLGLVTSGVIILQTTEWCISGQICSIINSIMVLAAPTLVNTLKEWIRGATGQ